MAAAAAAAAGKGSGEAVAEGALQKLHGHLDELPGWAKVATGVVVVGAVGAGIYYLTRPATAAESASAPGTRGPAAAPQASSTPASRCVQSSLCPHPSLPLPYGRKEGSLEVFGKADRA
jgi:hypothetical protein